MILICSLIVVSILVRDIDSFSDTTFVMTKGGLDEATTKELLKDYHRNLPTAVVRLDNESKFCAKRQDEMEGICFRIFGLQKVRDIVQTKYNTESQTNQRAEDYYRCRLRKIKLTGLTNCIGREPEKEANFIRCPTSMSRLPELQWTDFYVTIDHNGGYYVFGAPLADEYVQPIAHIEKHDT